MMAAWSAPRSEPANSQDLRPKAAQRALCRIIGQADSPVIDEAGEPVPAAQHVVDGLGDRGRVRQPGTLLAQPGFERRQQRPTGGPAAALRRFDH